MHIASNYVLSFKICSLVVGIHLAFLAPLLPFYRILHETNQQAQAIKKLIKSLGFSLFFLLGVSLLIYLFIEPLLRFWISREVVFYYNLLPWMILYGLINVFSIYLNSLEKVTLQNICLLLGLGIFSALTSFFKPSEELFCLASWICLLPLFMSNILEVLRISSLRSYIQRNSKHILHQK
jgi:O-antigen/teichoic acid export membrane protein